MPEPWTAEQQGIAGRFWRDVWTSGSPTDIQKREFLRIAERYEFDNWLQAMMDFHERDPRPIAEQSFRPHPGMIAASIRPSVAETHRDEKPDDPLDWNEKPRPEWLQPRKLTSGRG